jgi:monofunctional biosynthetic peptidoglycan transglycosylase
MAANQTSPFRHTTAILWMCLALTMNAHSASDKTLFDFTTSTHLPAWQIVNDDVMGGVSTSQFQVHATNAVFSGAVSLENNGGFASVRSATVRQNLDGLAAFVISVRGDGRRYKFTVRTETGFDTPIYQCAFATKRGEWEEHRLPFKEFIPTFRGRVLTNVPPLNPAKISSVGFIIADRQEGPFHLEIKSIRATLEQSPNQ